MLPSLENAGVNQGYLTDDSKSWKYNIPAANALNTMVCLTALHSMEETASQTADAASANAPSIALRNELIDVIDGEFISIQ